jgi:hypothetical protein
MPIIKINQKHLSHFNRTEPINVKPSPTTGNNHHKKKIRGPNFDVPNRTRFKVGHIDQNVGYRSRSKLQSVYNSTNNGVFKGQGN